MKDLMMVFIGGGTGSVVRYLFSRWFSPFFPAFPFSTFMANLLACMLFGVLTGLSYQKIEMNDTHKKWILTGFCGGLSTFSTFNFEIFDLIKAGHIGMALIYMFCSLVVCLLSFWLMVEICK
ncbi:MAG: fluoride efflux transporter CrcB [Cytophagales bacterium]